MEVAYASEAELDDRIRSLESQVKIKDAKLGDACGQVTELEKEINNLIRKQPRRERPSSLPDDHCLLFPSLL